jgi:nucleoside-diphosphate-sugar epimerase
VYGDPLVNPQPEAYFGNVDPIGPRSCYDEGKRFGEAAVAAAARTRGLAARMVRFFNCYGPRMESGDGRLVPALVQAAVEGRAMPIQGNGRQTRSMTYVSDAVSGLLRVVAAAPDWRPVNVGSDDERSVLDIARAVAAVMKVPFETAFEAARPGDPQRRRPELTAIRALGWRANVTLQEGLGRTSSWFVDQRKAFA